MILFRYQMVADRDHKEVSLHIRQYGRNTVGSI